MTQQFEPKARLERFCYHINTLYLFTASDFKTTVVPSSIFGILGALSDTLLLNPTSPQSTLRRIPLVILFVWLNLLLFNVGNQRQPAAMAEDAINKPWRPLPGKRLSAKEAKQLNWILYPVVVITSLMLGGLRFSLSLMILGCFYNQAGGGDVFYARNFLNAGGYLSFILGAIEVSTGNPDSCFTSAGQRWFLLVGAVIASTGHIQDIPDQQGDRVCGRKTVPLAFGDMNARISIAALVLGWSLVAPAFWKLGAWGHLLPVAFGGSIGMRILMNQKIDVEADKRTFLVWNAWVVSLYILPFI